MIKPEFQWGRFCDHISMGVAVGDIIVELNVSGELWFTENTEFRHTHFFQVGLVDGPHTRGFQLILMVIHFSIVWPATQKEVDDGTDYAD